MSVRSQHFRENGKDGKAVWNLTEQGGVRKKMKREKYACSCKNITYGMIEDCIKNGADSYEKVEKQLRFGTGCGKCKEFIQHLILSLSREI